MTDDVPSTARRNTTILFTDYAAMVAFDSLLHTKAATIFAENPVFGLSRLVALDGGPFSSPPSPPGSAAQTFVQILYDVSFKLNITAFSAKRRVMLQVVRTFNVIFRENYITVTAAVAGVGQSAVLIKNIAAGSLPETVTINTAVTGGSENPAFIIFKGDVIGILNRTFSADPFFSQFLPITFTVIDNPSFPPPSSSPPSSPQPCSGAFDLRCYGDAFIAVVGIACVCGAAALVFAVWLIIRCWARGKTRVNLNMRPKEKCDQCGEQIVPRGTDVDDLRPASQCCRHPRKHVLCGDCTHDFLVTNGPRLNANVLSTASDAVARPELGTWQMGCPVMVLDPATSSMARCGKRLSRREKPPEDPYISPDDLQVHAFSVYERWAQWLWARTPRTVFGGSGEPSGRGSGGGGPGGGPGGGGGSAVIRSGGGSPVVAAFGGGFSGGFSGGGGGRSPSNAQPLDLGSAQDAPVSGAVAVPPTVPPSGPPPSPAPSAGAPRGLPRLTSTPSRPAPPLPSWLTRGFSRGSNSVAPGPPSSPPLPTSPLGSLPPLPPPAPSPDSLPQRSPPGIQAMTRRQTFGGTEAGSSESQRPPSPPDSPPPARSPASLPRAPSRKAPS